jgi:hypothetical protein
MNDCCCCCCCCAAACMSRIICVNWPTLPSAVGFCALCASGFAGPNPCSGGTMPSPTKLAQTGVLGSRGRPLGPDL